MQWIPNTSLLPNVVIVHVELEPYGLCQLGIENTGHKDVDNFIVEFCRKYRSRPDSNLPVIEGALKLTEILGGEIVRIEYNPS